jgi:hypothetical protein
MAVWLSACLPARLTVGRENGSQSCNAFGREVFGISGSECASLAEFDFFNSRFGERALPLPKKLGVKEVCHYRESDNRFSH